MKIKIDNITDHKIKTVEFIGVYLYSIYLFIFFFINQSLKTAYRVIWK